ncbi:MAG: hypothetical protein ABH803_00220 [Candidatus Micrarchaeota archaeon]
MKTFLVLFSLFLVSFVSASCPFLDVSLVSQTSVYQGREGVFPISVTNTGLNSQLVSLSAACPENVECRFNEIPSITLTASQEKTFSLIASSNEAGAFIIPLTVSVGTSFGCDQHDLLLNVQPYSTLPEETFSVSMNPVINQSARPGETINYEFTISNNQNGVSKSFADLISNGFFDSISFNPVSMDLQAGETKKAKAKLVISPGTPAGVYQQSFRVRIVNQNGVQKFYDFSSQIFVFSETTNLQVENEPVDCIPVLHSDTANWRFSIKNNGENNGPFNARLEGDAINRIVSLDREVFEVKTGDKQDVIISLHPSNNELTGKYYYTLIIDYSGFELYRQEFCFNVYSKNDFEVLMKDEYTITRGKANVLIPFAIINNGSLTESFSIEIQQPEFFLLQPEPKSFDLGPGRKQDLFLVASTSLDRTELKTYEVKAVIHSKRSSKQVVFNIVVLADEYNSFLEIKTNQLHAIAGRTSKEFIEVKNTKSSVLRGVFITLEGLNPSWYSIEFPKRDINGFASATFEVEFKIPKGSPAINQFNIVVSSVEREVAKSGAVLYVDESGGELDVFVRDITSISDYETLVTVIVSNAGSTTIKTIKPVSSEAIVDSEPIGFDLAPGESKTIVLKVRNPESNEVSVAFTSINGVTSLATAIPINKPESLPWLPITLVAIGLLLVSYFFWVKPHENEY